MFYIKEIEGIQYDIQISGDPVVFDGNDYVPGEKSLTDEVRIHLIVFAYSNLKFFYLSLDVFLAFISPCFIFLLGKQR